MTPELPRTVNGQALNMPCAVPKCAGPAMHWLADNRFWAVNEHGEQGAFLCNHCVHDQMPDSMFVINPHFRWFERESDWIKDQDGEA